MSSDLSAISPRTRYAPPDAPSAPQRRWRGAIIGLGGIARGAHLPAFASSASIGARLDLVATVDASPAVAPVDGIPHFPSRDALAEAGPIDFVDICTPTASHLELTLWALEHGYHVLCEKPVAIGRADAARIAAAARASKRVVMACHQYRFNPAWQQVREWLRSDAIGRWHLAEFHVYRLMADRGASASPTPWRGLMADARGGVLLDHGTHLIYQLLDATGFPQSVRSWTGRLRHRDYDVEDTAHLVFEFPGRLGIMLLTWAARHRENRVRFVGESGTIDWTGGMLRLERDGASHSFDFTSQLDKASYAGWFADLFDAFADAMDRGECEAELRDIANVAAVLEGAYESARSGCATMLAR